MAGIDFLTGKGLDGWAHVVRSLQILFTTDIGSRVMLRIYGAGSGRILGQPMTVPTFNRFRDTIVIACELWEPRFRVHLALGRPEANTPETMRLGHLAGIELYGEYRPRGHLGDPTPEGDFRRIFIGFDQSSAQVQG